jgi:hypothetical protein
MEDVDRPVSTEDVVDGGSKPRNLHASVSLWSAVGAVVLLLMYQQERAAVLLFAVPTAAFLATAYGIVGLVRARRTGNGRAEALVGLLVGSGLLVAAGVLGLALWEFSRLQTLF